MPSAGGGTPDGDWRSSPVGEARKGDWRSSAGGGAPDGGRRSGRGGRGFRGLFANSSHRGGGGMRGNGAGRGFGRGNRGSNDNRSRGNGTENGRTASGQEVYPFGVKKLLDFLEKSNDEVIAAIDCGVQSYKENLRQANCECNLPMMTVLVQLIGEKFCADTALPEKQNGIIAVTCDDEFLAKLMTFSFLCCHSNSNRSLESVDYSPLRSLRALVNFYALVSSRMRTLASEKLLDKLDTASAAIELLRARNQVSETEVAELEQRIQKLKAELLEFQEERKVAEEETKTKKKSKLVLTEAERERMYLFKPPVDFRSMEIVPTGEEIRSEEEPFLRPNLVIGSYPSTLAYLDVQFRLLREDFMAPLREAVREYLSHEAEYNLRKKRMPPGTIRFYYDVKLKDVLSYPEVTVFSMQFSTANFKRVNWEKSKRLLNGSLVLLTPDSFSTIYFATVAHRDDKQLKDGIIGIVWEGERPASYQGVKFLMVECEVYFESYRHTLKALQFMGKPGPPFYDVPLLQTYRMAKYIVDVSSETIPPPNYLANADYPVDFSLLLKINQNEIRRQNNLVHGSAPSSGADEHSQPEDRVTPINFSTVVRHKANALNVTEWPTASELGMDEPQYEAFRAAITQELSIIQGPPGTGKTYIGLQIMKLLLSNRTLLWDSVLDSVEKALVEVVRDLQKLGIIPSQISMKRWLRDDDDDYYDDYYDRDYYDDDDDEFGGDYYIIKQKLKRLYELRDMKALHCRDLDPILIVCYTNHALDQFLEGILNIMKTIGISPSGNLVRVGGRSKVEAVEKYAIHHIKEHYLQYHLFPAGYATIRNRARAQLQTVQNCRADLKSLYRDLCISSGIINFNEFVATCDRINYGLDRVPCGDNVRVGKHHLMSQIEQIMSEELRNIFYFTSARMWINDELRWKLFNWLGLHKNLFLQEDFNADALLNKLFRIRRAAALPTMKEVLSNGNGTAEEEQEEDDDGELKSLLQAHRLDAEIKMEEVNTRRRAARLPCFELRSQDFAAQCEELETCFEKAYKENDHKLINQLNQVAWELELQDRIGRNMNTFLEKLLSAYNESRIELPEVTPELLARAHEKEPSLNEKWAIYFHLVEFLKKFLLEGIIAIESVIIRAQERLAEVNNQGDGMILQKAMVVGLTTTGAAKYNTLLRMMKSRIVIVEEAAEVLESHIVTSLTQYCEHLILIGDHKQLRPPTTVYKLAKDYNLDISLFERMIKNNIKWHHLRAQHRMRPEICKLLVPTIYEDLVDHSSVLSYPHVKGMAKNLFFVTHNQPEAAETDSMTKSNEYEAEYAVKLCRHLRLQGYAAADITILTTYIGQMFLIQKLMRQEGDLCRGVRVTVVDNFQGEENEVIILSLVRSNDENRIGFLKTENRICVALSRAKQGMYVICNMDCLLGSKSKTWESINEELQTQQSIGAQLQLHCEVHGDLITIDNPEDFRLKSPDGGCQKNCPAALPNCDYECRKICHVIDREHATYKCEFDCRRTCPDREKHACPHPCWQFPCPPCEFKMARPLLCGHIVELPCHVDYANHLCTEDVRRDLPCGHSVKLLCHVRVEDYVCHEQVEKTLDCGHKKVLPCHQPISEYACVEVVEKELPCGHVEPMECSADPRTQVCLALCEKELPCGHTQMTHCNIHPADVKCLTILQMTKSDCNHMVDVECWQQDAVDSWKCSAMCDTRLDCGHQCVLTCHVGNDPDHKSYTCRKKCNRDCPNGHPCPKSHLCHTQCEPCPQRLDRELPCGHKLNMRCSTDINVVKCLQPCARLVDCPENHQCPKQCFEPCTPCIVPMVKQSIDCEHILKVLCHESARREICEELVLVKAKSPCGHQVEVPCRIQDTCTPEELLKYCHQPCGHIVTTAEGGCAHPCKGDCSSCLQGRVHVKCREACNRTLTCGHVCKHPCSILCPPCEEKCILRCAHSSCKKKCGVPCTDCRERCKWSCEHKKCTRLCSELCNRDACDEPCTKKLKCGHDCIGSCGEPCPPLCRICNADVVQDIFFGDEHLEDARFVYLVDCGHVIHRESMDTWVRTNNGGDNKVAILRCPRCSSIITRSVRYGNFIKERLQGVLKVREKIFGNDKAQHEMQMDLADHLMSSGNKDLSFEAFRDWLQNMLFEFKRIPLKKGFRVIRELRKVDQYKFESLNNMFNWWREAEENMKVAPPPVAVPPPVEPRYVRNINSRLPLRLIAPQPPCQDFTTKYKTKMLDVYGELFSVLLQRAEHLPLTYQEIYDFDQEFERCYQFSRLYKRRSVENFETVNGAQFVFNQLEALLCQPKPYDEEMKMEFYKQLKTLDEILKTAALDSARQARSTFQAMGFASQHWYTCENGHLYVVADCSNFNAAGRCPDCNAPVGRGSNNVRVGVDESAVLNYMSSRISVQPPPINFDGGSSSRNVESPGSFRGGGGSPVRRLGVRRGCWR